MSSVRSGEGTRSLQAVLFDMDGTLLDSEKLWDIGLKDLAGWHGGVLSAATRERMVGSSLPRSVSLMHQELGIESDEVASLDFLVARTTELFATELVFKPGAVDLLHAVKAAGIPAALVTSTYRSLTDVALRTIGTHFFQVTVCGDEVAHPKPSPDPYLLAAQLLGVDPACCVAIEDSATGATSAEAAGCAVLAVPSEVPLDYSPRRTLRESLVGLTIEDLNALIREENAA